MFGFATILIVDENAYDGLDLSLAIEASDGCVAGPVSTSADVRIILDAQSIAGAIVDCDSDGCDAAEVIILLIEAGIPTVVQTVWPPPGALQSLNGKTAVLIKPVNPALVLAALLVEIGRE